MSSARPTLGQHYLAMLRHALAAFLVYSADFEGSDREVAAGGIRGIVKECARAGVWPEAKLLLMEAERREKEARA